MIKYVHKENKKEKKVVITPQSQKDHQPMKIFLFSNHTFPTNIKMERGRKGGGSS